jgi:CRP-like cAMP-binding protein
MDEARLQRVPLFADLSKKERKRVAQLADEIDLPAGKDLTKEGAFSYEFFALEQGTVEVRIGDRHIADLGPGDFFGEMGVLGDGVRTADVVTTSPITAIVLTGRDLRALVREMPSVGSRIESEMAARRAAMSPA